MNSTGVESRKGGERASRWGLVLILATLIPAAGCMAPVRAVGGLAKATADTAVTATKAGGILLKDFGQGTANATSSAWKAASRGNSPELEAPPEIP